MVEGEKEIGELAIRIRERLPERNSKLLQTKLADLTVQDLIALLELAILELEKEHG